MIPLQSPSTRTIPLLIALLAHQRTRRGPITYKQLIIAAGISAAPIGIGPDLAAIAEWCRANHYPPLNALVVRGPYSARANRPGAGYDGAGYFRECDWPQDVVEAQNFRKYPLLLRIPPRQPTAH